MIELTKLDRSKILLSLENIKYIESTPDTLIFFTNGESLMVIESMDEVARRVLEFNRQVYNVQSHNPS